MKRILPLILCVVLLLSAAALPVSASGASTASTARADKLYSLGLFIGNGNDASGKPIYSLEAQPTRLHGLIMLIRLLGVASEASASTEPNPFTDVKDHNAYGIPYVAYAYANNLTKGRSATAFDPDGGLDARSYVTFLLRALKYDDIAGDFSWDQALRFAASIGIMTADAAQKLASLTLNRGDMVDLSYAALTCKLKGSTQTLAETLCAVGVFTEAKGTAAGVLGSGAGWVYSYTPYDSSTVSYAQKTVQVTGGSLTANVITVNTQNSKVTVKSAMVDNKMGHTAPFSSIVEGSGAAAAVNANYFESYEAFKIPIGSVMVDGEYLYCDSGLTSLGITADGELRIGRPSVFTRLTSSSGSRWAVYSINTSAQHSSVSTLYTPAYGPSVAISSDCSILTVRKGVITAFGPVAAGTQQTIPADGYVVFMGSDFASTAWFRAPQVGDSMTMEYYLTKEDPECFTLDNVVSVVSGGPRLVSDGANDTDMEYNFSDTSLFGPTAASTRTAVGINGEGKLLLVSVSRATIQQMRELMLALGCVDAFCLDGGASCGMYCNGKYYSTPGRELTTTLQVFVAP